jgi:hypothetical protein
MHALVLASLTFPALVPPPEPPNAVSDRVVDDRPVCPIGDAPAELDTFVAGAQQEVLDVDDGTGEITLTRAFTSDASGPSAASWDVDLGGARAVVVAASVSSGAGTRELAIGDATDAANRFDAWKDALERGVDAGEVRAGPHEPGVMVAHTSSGVDVEIAAPCSVRYLVVTLHIAIASVPVDGAWRFDVPRLAEKLIVKSTKPLALRVDGRAAHRDQAEAIATNDANASALAPIIAKPITAPSTKLRARGFALKIEPVAAPKTDDDDVAPASPDESAPIVVARAELDVPKPLSVAPAGLRFVFVVDASVSVAEAALAKELQLVDEILAAAPPDAKFALVSASRKPRVVVPAWSSAADVAASSLAIDVENGSEIPAALKLAQGIASDVDLEKEVPRIIVVSDMKLKDGIDDAKLARAFRSPILTHVVVAGEGMTVEDPISWQRSFANEDARAHGPESTGGIWVEAWSGESSIGDDEPSLATHLVHPTRIDHPSITIGDTDVLDTALAKHLDASPADDPDRTAFASDAGLPVVLVEGSGIRAEAALAITPALTKLASRTGVMPSPTLRGFLWSTPLSQRAQRDESLLGLLAVDDVADSLSDDSVRAIANKSGAPSRVTSLLAIPSWRPPHPENLVTECSGCGCGCCGCCCGCRGVGCHGFGVGAAKGDLHEREFLAQLLAEDARACLTSHAKLAIEVADREILDVRVINGGACVVERTWQRRLDKLADQASLASAAFRAHNTFIVDAAEAGAAGASTSVR